MYSLSFLRDSSAVLAGFHDNSQAYSAEDGKLIKTFGVMQILFWLKALPDGRRFVSGSADRTLRVWDIDTGELLKVFRGHKDEITALAVSSDGEVCYTASKDGTVRSWFLGESYKEGFTEKLTNYGIYSLELSPDGRRIAAYGANRTFNEETQNFDRDYPFIIAEITDKGLRQVSQRFGHTSFSWALSWAPDVHIVTGGLTKGCTGHCFKEPFKGKGCSKGRRHLGCGVLKRREQGLCSNRQRKGSGLLKVGNGFTQGT